MKRQLGSAREMTHKSRHTKDGTSDNVKALSRLNKLLVVVD
jgi:hypothetical protein